MTHSCRKCLCELSDLHSANNYSEISAINHLSRNDQTMHENYLEKKELEVTHINGIKAQSLFFEFPYFITSKMLPQCSSHDYLG